MKADKMLLDSDLQEHIEHGSVEFPLQYYVDELHTFDNNSLPLHWHNALEFVVVHHGSAMIQAGNASYEVTEGDGIFLNMNTLHGFQQVGTSGKCECPNIVFADEFLAPMGSAASEKYIKPIILNKNIPYVTLRRGVIWQKELLDRLDLVFSILQKNGTVGVYGQFPYLNFTNQDVESVCYEMQVQAELLGIWEILYMHKAELESQTPDQDYKTQLRMQTMIRFIQKNYAEKITLLDISDSAGISKSECSRCFQKYMHLSPIEYLIRYRIEKAKKLLRSGHSSIETIAVMVGFDSSAYFCRVFKCRVGMTPRAYQLF